MNAIIFYLKNKLTKINKLKSIINQLVKLPYQYLYLKKYNNKYQRFSLKLANRWVCLGDNVKQDTFDRHYVFHCAWAARVLKKIKPNFHIDISSSINFITIASAFIPIKFYDYRPLKINLQGLETDFADLENLNFDDESVESISCMHVIEHIGLGRYGDRLDYNGDLKAIKELKRVVKNNGNLILVVPISGEDKIQFNAHRVYRYATIIDYFSNFELIEFSLIRDDRFIENPFIQNATENDANAQVYGCGCFHLRKIK